MELDELLHKIYETLNTYGIKHPKGHTIYVAYFRKFHTITEFNKENDLTEIAVHLGCYNRTIPLGYVGNPDRKGIRFVVETDWFSEIWEKDGDDFDIIGEKGLMTANEGIKEWNNYIQKCENLELLNQRIVDTSKKK